MEAVENSVSVGQVLEFDYPAANYRGARFRWERRRVLVERVRDLAEEPLDPVTCQLDPELRRGRLLVTGQDLDRRAERSFYAESMREVRPGSHDFAVVLDESPGRIVYRSDDPEEAESWATEWNSFEGVSRAFVAGQGGAVE